MFLVENDDVVEALAADGTDQAFHERTGRSRRVHPIRTQRGRGAPRKTEIILMEFSEGTGARRRDAYGNGAAMTEPSSGPPGFSICGPLVCAPAADSVRGRTIADSRVSLRAEIRSAEAGLLCPLDRRVTETRNAIARRTRITNTLAIEPGGRFTHPPSDSWARVRCERIPAAARAFVFSSSQLPCGSPSSVMSRGTYLLESNTCH